MNHKTVLVISSTIIFPVMTLVFSIATTSLGKEPGYFAGFAIYWIYCIAITIYVVRRQKQKLTKLFHVSLPQWKGKVFSALAFVPVVAVLFIQFLPHRHALGTSILLLVIVNAIFNGLIEELYWRGLYLIAFSQNPWMGLVLPSLLFASWHIALYTIPGMSYGGFAPLVGGSFIMGFLWGLVARKLNGIFYPTIAHIAANFFAFSGLYIVNSF